MTNKKINYDTFSERRLLNNLENARNKISTLSSKIKALDKRRNVWISKEVEIKKALANKYIPNDETIKALQESIANEGQGEIIEADENTALNFHRQMKAELENES